MRNEGRQTETSPPIACSFSDSDLAGRRRDPTGDVFGGALKVRTLEDVFKFALQDKTSRAAGLVEVINAERACRPFFAFEPGVGTILSRVQGPEETKVFVQTELLEPHRANAGHAAQSVATLRPRQPLLDG